MEEEELREDKYPVVQLEKAILSTWTTKKQGKAWITLCRKS